MMPLSFLTLQVVLVFQTTDSVSESKIAKQLKIDTTKVFIKHLVSLSLNIDSK